MTFSHSLENFCQMGTSFPILYTMLKNLPSALVSTSLTSTAVQMDVHCTTKTVRTCRSVQNATSYGTKIFKIKLNRGRSSANSSLLLDCRGSSGYRRFQSFYGGKLKIGDLMGRSDTRPIPELGKSLITWIHWCLTQKDLDQKYTTSTSNSLLMGFALSNCTVHRGHLP